MRRTRQAASRISNFAECGSHAYVLRSITEPDYYRVAGSSCHDRFCVVCANERSRAIAGNVIAHLGTTRCRFVTLTVRTGAEPLTDCLERLYQGFAALRRSPVWRRCVTGGVSFVELKWNPVPGRWHPHIHAIVTGKYMPHADLKQAWIRATAGSSIVHIGKVGDSDTVARYVTKYASKPLNGSFSNDDDRLDEAILALKGRRLCTTFGGWRKVLLVDHPDETAWEHLGPLDDWIYRAANGDADARDLLRRLSPDTADLAIATIRPTERAPPDVKATRQFHQTEFGDWMVRLPTFNP